MARTKRIRRVRLALIGAGTMASEIHYPSLSGFKDVEFVGLCDLIPDKLNATAKRFGITRVYQDFRKMLDETKPQAVCAFMPPHHLYDVAIEILQRGHDLMVEKPPALTVFQTECMAKLAADNRCVTAVGFQRRYHPLFARCRDEVQRHGPIHQVVSTFYKNLPPAPVHPYYRGAIDILTSDAIHAADALRFFAGGEVVRVVSDVRRIDSWYFTCFNAMVAFDNGATGMLLANWRTGGRRLALELHATGCSAFANADGIAEIVADNAAARTLRHTEVANSELPCVHQGFQAQARAFINAVKSRRPPHNNLSDAVKTMRLVEAIYRNSMSEAQQAEQERN